MAALTDDRRLAYLAQAAMAGAAIMMAHHVAGKAARDALFLDRFPATDLPRIIFSAALVGVIGGLACARLLVRCGPASVLPIALLGSVALHLGEFALVGRYRGPVVVFTYLHIVSSTTILLSMFWGVANEAFSPGEAKRHFGRIAAAGTVGGIAGGLLAERVAVGLSLDSMLLLLAFLHAISAIVATVLGRLHAGATATGEDNLVSTVQGAVGRAPFLKSLGLLVFCVAVSAGLIDFLFKSSAVATYGKGPDLARFFAFFYAGIQTAAFLLQGFVTPIALRVFGLGRTVMALPIVIATGGIASFWIPGFVPLLATRASEAALRGSLFRAGYELFFTPVPAHEKRAVKTAIDAGCDRMGDVVAAVAVQGFLMLGLASAVRPLLVLMILFAGVCIWISARMDRAYLRVLEHGLKHRAVELDTADVQDSTTLSALMRSIPLIKADSAPPSPATSHVLAEAAARSQRTEPSLDRLRVLRSGVAVEVRRDLAQLQTFDAAVVPQTIRLLAWDEVTEEARHYLEAHLSGVAGQLADCLLDRSQDFSVRRRIPRILAQHPTQRTVEALQEALDDQRFEIRFQCSRALEFMNRSSTGLRFNASRMMEVVEKELSVSHGIWASRRLLENRDDWHSQAAYLDEVLRGRSHQSLEHVFSLLAIVLPRDPLKLAFRALHSEDRLLRGLGVEYLETALPSQHFALLRGMLQVDSEVHNAQSSGNPLEALLASHQSILLSVKNPSSDAAEPVPPQPSAIKA